MNKVKGWGKRSVVRLWVVSLVGIIKLILEVEKSVIGVIIIYFIMISKRCNNESFLLLKFVIGVIVMDNIMLIFVYI